MKDMRIFDIDEILKFETEHRVFVCLTDMNTYKFIETYDYINSERLVSYTDLEFNISQMRYKTTFSDAKFTPVVDFQRTALHIIQKLYDSNNELLNDCINFDGGKLTDIILEKSSYNLEYTRRLLKWVCFANN